MQQVTEVAAVPTAFNELLERIDATDEAEFLSVDGKRKYVVLSYEAHNKLIKSAERFETTAKILEKLAEVARGEKRPVDKVFDEIEVVARKAAELAAIREGLEQVERGECRPIEEFFQEIAAKYNFNFDLNEERDRV